MRSIYLLLTIFLALGTSSCKTKKIDQEIKKETIEEVVKETEKEVKKEDRKTEEKGSKQTEEKSTETADRKTETKDEKGNTTTIYENYYKGSESKSNEEFQKMITESMTTFIATQSEMNKKNQSDITALKETNRELKNSLIYGSIIAGSIVLLIIIIFIINKFNLKRFIK